MADLVILGNGFDLNVGMKTSYNDYFSKIEAEGVVENFCKECDKLLTPHPDLILSLKRKYPEVTFWDIVFYILKEVEFEKWNDVERGIYEIINIGNQSVWEDYQNSKYLHEFDKYLRKKNYSKIRYTRALHNYCQRSMFTKENMYEFQLGELKRYEQKFAQYIIEQDSLATKETQDKISNLLFDITEPFDHQKSTIFMSTSILSFNYTNTIHKSLYWGERTLDNSFIPIHGQATDNVIFGIDEVANIDKNLIEFDYESPLYPFTKTARIMKTPQVTRSFYKSSLSPNVDTIRFYGHSLSKFDYSYFQSIFDFYDIYHKKVNLKFFYSIYCKDKEEEITKNQMNCVIKLLKTYGTTMDNHDHGKNLLHKLILEGRLKITKIPKGPREYLDRMA